MNGIDMQTYSDAMQRISDRVADKVPSVGTTVRVLRGKHKNKGGKVFWHGVNKLSDAWRYGDSSSRQMRTIMGRYGYRVGILPKDGKKFFIDADDVEVITN